LYIRSYRKTIETFANFVFLCVFAVRVIIVEGQTFMVCHLPSRKRKYIRMARKDDSTTRAA
jgi:calcineurin-like phosphoesterase family protein